MDELAHSHERELRALMTSSLDGDAGAYHAFLERLTGHLRALLPAALCADRAWSCRSRGPSARGLDFDPYPSAYVRPVATFHAVDLCNRALQISGLSPADQVGVQGHADGDRRTSDGQQRPGCCRKRIGFAAADVEDLGQGETGDSVRKAGRTEH